MTKVDYVVMDIGFFFYAKAVGDLVAKTNQATKEVMDLGITGVSLDGSVAVIKLLRPGLLIGRKGETIDALRKYLQNSQGITDIRIEEDRTMPNLYAFQVGLDNF